ncbi:MAG: NAD(P)-dependent oxidoreductase [Ignavibacteriales bacterium]|nr:NAD(P)-dependent oxidoreductase [Ignavibacteriales bacterium]
MNTMGTYHMLEACARSGIRKFVFMSSESTLGFAFARSHLSPLFLPIDERHPLRPQDPYGLSKATGELLCRGYSAAYGMETVCLRAPWIWVPKQQERALYRQLIEQYHLWWKNLWAYVHVLDVANAIMQSLQRKVESNHIAAFVCAKENWTGIPSRELIAKHYPETKEISPEIVGAASLISYAYAQQTLGYEPQYTLNDLGLNSGTPDSH